MDKRDNNKKKITKLTPKCKGSDKCSIRPGMFVDTCYTCGWRGNLGYG